MYSMLKYYKRNDFVSITTEGREKVVGIISGFSDDGVDLLCYGHKIHVPFNDIYLYVGEKRNKGNDEQRKVYEVLPSTYSSMYDN